MRRGRLRPATSGDLSALLELLHDKDVRRYLCDNTILPRETVASMLADSERLAVGGLGLWMIEAPDGGLIGAAGLHPVSDAMSAVPELRGGIEPIIALAPTSWRQGLAAEAVGALITYARQSLRLAQLVAAVDEPNVRSRQLMLRCGFVPVGQTEGPANTLILYCLRFDDNAEQTDGHP